VNSFVHLFRVVRQALKDDRARRKAHVRSTDADFLPAALEVIERPVSPTGRRVAWVLLIGLVVTMLWLVFGRVDVVASAPGRLVPTGSVKIIQSAGSGVVRTIYVHDGDSVHAGQPLLDLDPTLSAADLAQSQKALAGAELDVARNRAIADALAGRGLNFDPPSGTPVEVVDTQRRLVAAQLAELEASVSSLSAARASSLSDAGAAAAQISKLDETTAILDQELANMKRLDSKGYASGIRLLELQRQRRQEQGDRDVALAQQARGYSEARKLAEQINQARETARRTALTDLAKAEAEAILRREEVTKATQKRRFQRLLAPADGTIQQLAIHTIGGVVEPARTLMILVPTHGGIEAEVQILNKDVGFIHVGQLVAVKLEAFPFTRYGAVPGHVVRISRDAVPDRRLGSVYVATVALDRASISVDGRGIPLSAGLTATADIRTGSRRIISYLLSPLQTSVAQAGHEQ